MVIFPIGPLVCCWFLLLTKVALPVHINIDVYLCDIPVEVVSPSAPQMTHVIIQVLKHLLTLRLQDQLFSLISSLAQQLIPHYPLMHDFSDKTSSIACLFANCKLSCYIHD